MDSERKGGKAQKKALESRVNGKVSSPESPVPAQRKRSKPRGALSHPETGSPQDFHLRFFSLRWVKLCAQPRGAGGKVVLQEWGLQRHSLPSRRTRSRAHPLKLEAA